MSLRLKVFPLLSLALFMASCATIPYEPYAREVKKRPHAGGTIALNATHRPEDRARAEQLMTVNCGTGTSVKVVEEGEVVVGTKTDATERKATGYDNSFQFGNVSFGSPSDSTNTTAQTTQLKEWHISYECLADTAETTTPVAKKSKRK